MPNSKPPLILPFPPPAPVPFRSVTSTSYLPGYFGGAVTLVAAPHAKLEAASDSPPFRPRPLFPSVPSRQQVIYPVTLAARLLWSRHPMPNSKPPLILPFPPPAPVPFRSVTSTSYLPGYFGRGVSDRGGLEAAQLRGASTETCQTTFPQRRGRRGRAARGGGRSGVVHGGEALAEGVFGDDAGEDELDEVVGAAGF
jgi:hypothetical protein